MTTPGTLERAASKDQRAALVSLRTKLAREIDSGPGARDLAGLAKQFTEVLDKIAALDGAKPAEVSPSDELANRRAARRAGAAAS
jgi:hypothetical protein